MRKFIAMFLAFVLLLGLVGCAKESQEPPKSASFTLTDLLVFQADTLSRQMAMSAEESYMTALSSPPQVVSAAEVFTTAIEGTVDSGKLLSGAPADFETKILEICGQVTGSMELAACGMLTRSTVMHFPIPLEKSTAVYLRYSDACHFVVLFKPMNNGLVSLWAYPLFADAAEKVVEQFFAEATDLSSKAIRQSCEVAAKANFDAYSPSKKVDASYYTSLAKTIFGMVRPLTKEDLVPYVNDVNLIAKAIDASAALASGFRDMTVYQCPMTTKGQSNYILSQTSYRQQLMDATQQLIYLAVPNQMVNTFGMEWTSLSALLAKTLHTNPLQITAQKDEAPVLILMQYNDSYSVVLSIYANAHNAYMYSFAVLPVSYTEAQAVLAKAGARPMN